jgi:hypothetical protein
MIYMAWRSISLEGIGRLDKISEDFFLISNDINTSSYTWTIPTENFSQVIL